MTGQVFNIKPEVEPVETGIDNELQVVAKLAGCLADSYLLMMKTQSCHWNAVGPLFQSVHVLTEAQYDDMFEAIDDLAERIRALGHTAPTSITEMMALSALEEESGNPTTLEMLETLIQDHETIAKRLRDTAERAEAHRDLVTADLLTGRIAFHEKAHWMFRAMLAQ